MEHFRGRLLKDRRLLFSEVEGKLEFHVEVGGWVPWSGHFDKPTGVDLPLGEKYWLELEDGRAGEIFITGWSTTQPIIASFEGNGALK